MSIVLLLACFGESLKKKPLEPLVSIGNRWTRAVYSYHHRTSESNCPVFELQFFLLLKWCFEHFKHAGPHLPQAEAHYQKDHSKCFPQYRVAQFHLGTAWEPCQILTHKEENIFFSSLPVSRCHWEILGQIHLHTVTLSTTLYFFVILKFKKILGAVSDLTKWSHSIQS